MTEEDLHLDLRIYVKRASGARPDRPLLREVCRRVLIGEGVGGPVCLSLHLVDDDAIAKLNAKHRDIDRPTDVLSFPLIDHHGAEAFALPPGQTVELGDIVVSYPRVVAQASELGHSEERELAYLTAHGVLHILGHDHEEDAEQALMRQREEAALAAVGLIR